MHHHDAIFNIYDVERLSRPIESTSWTPQCNSSVMYGVLQGGPQLGPPFRMQPIKVHPETPRTSQYYCTEGFKRCSRLVETSQPLGQQKQVFPVWHASTKRVILLRQQMLRQQSDVLAIFTDVIFASYLPTSLLLRSSAIYLFTRHRGLLLNPSTP